MPETTVNTKIKMTTEGTQEAVRDYTKLTDEAEKTAEGFKLADMAAKGLNSTLAKMSEWKAAGQAAFADLKGQATALGDGVKGVADKFDEAGQATEMLASSLDSVLPGLGGMLDSFASMNVLAIAGTAALTGITLIMGELQKQTDATRAAIEAQIQADIARAGAQSEIDQRVNFARTGNDEARQSVISDLAANTAEAKNLSDKMVEVNTQLVAAKEDIQRSIEMGSGGFTLFNTATDSIAKLEVEASALTTQLKTNADNFLLLDDAAKKLGITSEELAAVNLAVTQGAEGSAAALNKLWTAGEAFANIGDAAANTHGDAGETVVIQVKRHTSARAVACV